MKPLAALALGVVTLAAPVGAASPPSAGFEVEVLLERRDVIWGFDFLPDGRIILTERGGRVALFDPKAKRAQEVKGAPEVFARGQGGLLDVRVHPRFSENRWIYLTYSEPVGKKATTALARARLEGHELKGLQRLFSAREPSEQEIHFGSRLEFDGPHLFMTVGERNDRRTAQVLERHTGKILRLTHDGTAAEGNPFAGRPGALPEIWSLGHRNPQGLALRPGTGELWSAEFGPRGGDELNRIRPGANYGWPVITYGREYWGPRIGEGTEKEGLERPVSQWTPSISPSGLAFYEGKAFPAWRGNAFLACLSGNQLRRVAFKGGQVAEQEVLLGERGWRFRHVRQGPDDLLYFSTDEGKLGRLSPKP
ncbi:MAG: PQQ-dependent sugar dehydrogenase [Elusimicrobia bacterium]|nr:PQQ-dependent sugar dehydrogenase [Elusimicrobiota bacterium]